MSCYVILFPIMSHRIRQSFFALLQVMGMRKRENLAAPEKWENCKIPP